MKCGFCKTLSLTPFCYSRCLKSIYKQKRWLINSKNFFVYSSMLKPQPPAKPSIELLAQAPTMDNNRLEKLVKNFVVEDKARLAARNKTMPSSIQYALQKFEKNSQGDLSFVKKTATPSTPTRNNNYSSPVSSPSPSLVSHINQILLFSLFSMYCSKLIYWLKICFSMCAKNGFVPRVFF